MSYLLLIFLIFLGFHGGLYYSDYGLSTGNIIFTNFKSEVGNDTTFSDVYLIGERKYFRRQIELIYKNYPLYDREGNRLLRMIENSKMKSTLEKVK